MTNKHKKRCPYQYSLGKCKSKPQGITSHVRMAEIEDNNCSKKVFWENFAYFFILKYLSLVSTIRKYSGLYIDSLSHCLESKHEYLHFPRERK